jgi:prevent-host-death family protein
MSDDVWQAAEARHRFSEVVDAAVEGHPQFVRRRDGREVVIVSKEYFNQTKPNLKTYLMGSGYADDREDAFDMAMRGVRSDSGAVLRARNIEEKD